MPFAVLYITYESEKTAKTIVDRLIEAKLIAGANLFPITSAYWWKGAVQNEGEWVSILQTSLENTPLVEQKILEWHPYEIPCIIKIDASANIGYEKWVQETTKKEKGEH